MVVRGYIWICVRQIFKKYLLLLFSPSSFQPISFTLSMNTKLFFSTIVQRFCCFLIMDCKSLLLCYISIYTRICVFSVWPFPEVENYCRKQIWNEIVHIIIFHQMPCINLINHCGGVKLEILTFDFWPNYRYPLKL